MKGEYFLHRLCEECKKKIAMPNFRYEKVNPKTGKKEINIEAAKMSKSKPNSGVYMTDTPSEIKKKINSAYCPEREVEFNPILDWAKYLIFYDKDSKLEIKRDEKFGGNIAYSSYEDLEKDYADKKLHPQDLKNAVAEWLIEKLAPARKYFEDPYEPIRGTGKNPGETFGPPL